MNDDTGESSAAGSTITAAQLRRAVINADLSTANDDRGGRTPLGLPYDVQTWDPCGQTSILPLNNRLEQGVVGLNSGRLVSHRRVGV
ncbi:hypothetical protein A5686_19140 [Mycobacterium sp. E2479]|nr:hypothetical protein A5686_19140 [Mycobacterium sp. E2479]